MIGGSVLGLLAGLVAPLTLAFATPIIGAVGIILYAWAGLVPTVLFGLAGAITSSLLGGRVFVGMFAVAVLLPAGIAIWAVRKKMDYKKCMRVSVFVQTAAFLLALALVWLNVRGNLVDMLVEGLTETLRNLPPEYMSDYMDNMLMALAGNSLFGQSASSVDLAKGYLDAAEREVLIAEYGALIADAYKVGLAGMILPGCVLTGVVSVAAPMWIWARRGDERGIRRLPMSEWRVDANAAIGLPVCAVISYILACTGYPGGEAVWYAVWQLYLLILKFQCMGALSRMGKRGGASPFMRGAMLFMVWTMASGFASFAGAVSLYFGSKGLISEFIRKKKKDQEGEQ